jgi:hypothetical protein
VIKKLQETGGRGPRWAVAPDRKLYKLPIALFLIETLLPIQFRGRALWLCFITQQGTNTHTNTQKHTHTLGRTPLDEWSALQRDLYLHSTQQTQGKIWIQTREPNNRAAADLCCRQHGYRNRRLHIRIW